MPFDDKDRLLMYTHLRSFESDFDKAQSQLRAIASAWSAAALAAVALITINSLTPFVVGPGATLQPETVLSERMAIFFALRGMICLVASLGILVFWFLDQGVYQRLLHTVFAHGLYLELKNPELPQIRSSLFAANRDVGARLGWFFRVQFWAFFVLSLLFVVFTSGATTPAIGVLGVHFAIGIATELIAFCRGQSLPQIVENFYPELNAAWPPLKDPTHPNTVAWKNRIAPTPAGAIAADAAAAAGRTRAAGPEAQAPDAPTPVQPEI
jgi:hypothetical protein